MVLSDRANPAFLYVGCTWIVTVTQTDGRKEVRGRDGGTSERGSESVRKGKREKGRNSTKGTHTLPFRTKELKGGSPTPYEPPSTLHTSR